MYIQNEILQYYLLQYAEKYVFYLNVFENVVSFCDGKAEFSAFFNVT